MEIHSNGNSPDKNKINIKLRVTFTYFNNCVSKLKNILNPVSNSSKEYKNVTIHKHRIESDNLGED